MGLAHSARPARSPACTSIGPSVRGERPELRPICGDDTHDAADSWSFVNYREGYEDCNLGFVIMDETHVISHDLLSSDCDGTSDQLFR
jgi:hypothetical protein